jgi:Protein of unknown function (DUF1501)
MRYIPGVTILGSMQPMCQGFNRRTLLQAGGLSLLGGIKASPSLAAKEGEATLSHPAARARSVVLIYLQGGPPTQDMFDLKPNAPDGVGGEFQPIASSVPGTQVCEHLPLTANWMHKSAIVRSVYHNGGCHKNLPMYTGYDVNLPDEEFRDSDPPSMGSVCAYLDRERQRELPTYAYLPCPLGWGENRKKAGPHGGFLGRQYDPFSTECTAFVDHPPDDIWKPQVVRGEPHLTDTKLREGITLDRLDTRRKLVDQFDEQLREVERRGGLGNLPAQRQLAYDILTSQKVREAFDISRETDQARERYGRTLFGSATLLARRLVERGVKFVNVSWDNHSKRFEVSKAAWDTHERNFPMLRETLLPNFDQTYSAFIADLDARGLLDQTLVVTMGEMGRTPKINANGGRDHWTYCYGVLMAGAGIKQGAVYGASDDQAAFIKDKPVHIKDVVATIYHILGIDPEMAVLDRAKRPVPIAHGGRPILEILS